MLYFIQLSTLLMLWTTRMCCYLISAFLLHCLTCNLQNITMSCEIGSTTFYFFFKKNLLLYNDFCFSIISSMFTSKQITKHIRTWEKRKQQTTIVLLNYRYQTSIFNSNELWLYEATNFSLEKRIFFYLLFIVMIFRRNSNNENTK